MSEPTITLLVDGERFIAQESSEEPLTYFLTWVSGPNDQYGFSMRRHPATPLVGDDFIPAIREFLAGIDPSTGYLRDDDEED